MKVVDTHHGRSPLVQGGLEILVEVTVEMAQTEKNELAIKKFEDLVTEKYKEPVNGKFDDATDAIFKRLKCDEDSGSSNIDVEFDVDVQNSCSN